MKEQIRAHGFLNFKNNLKILLTMCAPEGAVQLTKLDEPGKCSFVQQSFRYSNINRQDKAH